jgi:hypothetical protein
MSGPLAQLTTLAAETAALDAERFSRYRQYLDFYQGDQWTGRRRAGETRLTFNYARALVRKTVSYLMATPVTFNVLPDAGQSAEALAPSIRLAEAALNEVYAAHDQALVDVQSAIDAAVLGDGAFKVTWDAARRRPRIAPVDPAGLWAWWEPDQPGAVYRVAQRYLLTAEEAERLFSVRPLGQPSATARRTVVEEWTAARYRVELDGVTLLDQPNPYGWIPYVIY